MDVQVEQTIQIFKNLFRAWVIDLKEIWDGHLPLIEFSYNNNYDASITMAPFEALYGKKCRSLGGWFEVGEFSLYGPQMLYKATEKYQLIKERFKITYSQKNVLPTIKRENLN